MNLDSSQNSLTHIINTSICEPVEMKDVLENFQEISSKFSEHIAVFDAGTSYSYKQLFQDVGKLSAELKAGQISEGDVVAVIIDRNYNYFVSILAILNCNAAFLPVDPNFPEERIEFFCTDANVSLILCDQNNIAYPNNIKALDVSKCLKTRMFSTYPSTIFNPESVAYIIYTSGSTGIPKGVKISRKALANFISGAISLYHITSEDRVLQFSNLSFDASIEEIFCSFCSGASLYLRTDEMLLANELIQFSVVHQISVWDLPTAFWRQIIYSSDYQSNLLPDQLRLVIIGGEAVTKNDVIVWNKSKTKHRLYNTYGPTETTVVALAYEIKAGYSPEKSVPIGRPLPGYKIYITDSDKKMVPVGITGELLVGGDSVALGYLNRNLEQEKAFIWFETPEDGMQRCYCTGDLAMAEEDGMILYQGRADRQVKIRGYRVELGEIESVLSSHEAIQDIRVILREDHPSDKRLVAYVLKSGEIEPEQIELRRFLQLKLPEYMVPSAFVYLDKFPLTPNGKIDIKSLPVPSYKKPVLSVIHIEPHTPTEIKLAAIWKEILNTEIIGAEDNFFELGGHSLYATMLISRINEKFHVRLSLKTIFEKQILNKIAFEIDQQNSIGEPSEDIEAIPHLEVDAVNFPLSSGQRRLWFIQNFEPGNLAYHIPFEYRIDGELDADILQQTISLLVGRHETLRTTIQTVDGIPEQKVHPSYPFLLEVINLDNLPENEKLIAAKKYSQLNEKHLFDLSTGPLFICKLLRISSEKHILLLNLHHIITDGWSVRIFMEELGHIYTSLKQQNPIILSPLPITYTDFASWQNTWLEGEGYSKQLAYWKNELKGAPEILQLPLDYHRPNHQTYDGDEVRILLDQSVTEELQHFSQSNNVSLFVTLLSIFNSLLTRYTSQEEFVIGIPIAGRIHKEFESLCGMFINNFPLRITPKEHMSLIDMLELCKLKFFQAYENQELPLDRIVEELKVTRYANVPPLFQVMFNLLGMFDEEISLAGSKMEMADKKGHIAQFDLSLHIYETKKSLNCVFEYNTNLFKKERIERMAGHFSELVKSFLKDPSQNIRKAPILTPKEKELVFGEWNATQTAFPDQKGIHQLFEEQVIKTPDSIAIQDDRSLITYRELNEKANQLARHLHHSGAIEGSVVGVCIERSTDLLVALMAVMKAGCTYIPLDPIYPKDRLTLIIDDGNPVIMLTEKKLLESLPESNAKNIFVEEFEAYKHESVLNTDFLFTSNTVAYLIYTSGSTGKPKGVQIEHRSLANFLYSMSKMPGINSEDVMLAVTTISFDIAGLELFLPILFGARIVIATQETSINPEILIEKIESCMPTILQATPVTFRMLNSSNWSGSKNLKILCGGEALPKELAIDLIGKCGELWNMYGPTETTVWSTVEKVEVDQSDLIGYVNLGKPIDNTLIYVLNSEFQPVPVGYPGELFIGGDGLAKGYFNLPELTKEKFLPDPFSEISGARMYRTGDLVQQTEKGKLEFLNRVDSQVKIRGFRIELGEIESAFAQYPTTRENVVIVREDTPGDKRLIAYIIRQENTETDISELRLFLKSKIPDYMVPSFFVFISQFPLTPNGKIDRKALPPPEDSQQDSDRIFVEPQTEMEKKLAQIWCDVLKSQRIGTDENFFEIGGHSMIAVTLMTRIEKELGIRLPLATLFNHSNIRDMAQFLEKNEQPARWGSLVPIKPNGRKRPLYLVHGAGLNLLLYTTIVSLLDEDQPVFGLQAKGLDGIDEPLDTIEAIAAYYIGEILAIDQSGTYALAGFSLGGQIAYEMARQLLILDKKVSFLGVFDTVSYNVSHNELPIHQRVTYFTDNLYRMVAWNIKTLINKPAEKKLEFFRLKWRSMIQKITKNDYTLKPEGVSEGKQSELPKYLHKVHQANYQAMEKYKLPVYPGKMYLFRAMDQSFYIKDPVLYGWDLYVKGGIVVLDIPGEHSRIFAPPNDALFANALQKSLNETNSIE